MGMKDVGEYFVALFCVIIIFLSIIRIRVLIL